jgi:hypothetical protein
MGEGGREFDVDWGGQGREGVRGRGGEEGGRARFEGYMVDFNYKATLNRI